MNIYSFFLIAFLVMVFLLAFYVYLKTARRVGFSMEQLQYIRSHWIRIIDSFEVNPSQAILDADKILDYALEKSGFQGTLADKLKKAGRRFSNLDGVWAAHKMRNQVAHELGELDMREAKRALENFKRALSDLGAGL